MASLKQYNLGNNIENIDPDIKYELGNLKNEIKTNENYPTIKKYEDKLKDFLKGDTTTLNLSNTEITGEELEGLFKELSKYKKNTFKKEKNLLNNIGELNLSFCKNLREIPSLENAINLKTLNLSNSNIKDLQLKGLKSIESCKLTSCRYLKSFEILGNFSNLKNIDLSRSKNLKKLELSGNFPKLENIDLYNIESIESFKLSGSFASLKKISYIDLKLGTEKILLLELSGDFPKLEVFDIDGFKNIKKITILGNLPNLNKINLYGCKKLEDLVLSDSLANLTHLNLSECESLKNLVLPGLNNLTSLNLYGCKKLEDLVLSDSLANLTHLNLSECKSLKNLVLPDLNNLTSLNLSGCLGLQNLTLSNMSKINKLDLSWCLGLQNVNLPDNFNYIILYDKTEKIEFEGNIDLINLNAFFGYFKDKKIQVGKKKISINLRKHKNILMGLIKTIKVNPKNENENEEEYFEKIQGIYETNIIEFIQHGKERLYDIEDLGDGKEKLTPKSDNIVFSIFDKDDVSNTKEYREKSNKYFKSLCNLKENEENTEKFKNYNVYGGSPKTPIKIIKDIQTTIEESPNSQIIIKMTGHGHKDGSMNYNGTKFTKEDFKILFNLGPNVHLNITSCNSGYKDDNTIYNPKLRSFEEQIRSIPNFANNNLGSLVLDSSLQGSIGGNIVINSEYNFYDAFVKIDENGRFIADYDGNGVVTYHEALIYRSLNYNYLLTPIVQDGIEIVCNYLSPKIGNHSTTVG